MIYLIFIIITAILLSLALGFVFAHKDKIIEKGKITEEDFESLPIFNIILFSMIWPITYVALILTAIAILSEDFFKNDKV